MRIRHCSSLRSLWFAGIVLLFFTPSGQAQSTSCPVPSPGTHCGVSVGISPFVTGGVFGGFQSNPGTGVSAPITITFSPPVASVSVTALDPDFPGNRMDAFNASGGLVSSAPFVGDGTPGVFTTSTATVTGAGIARVVLVPAPAEFVAYNGLSFAPGGPKIEITLVPEPPGNQYIIAASPGMPTIQAKARVVGVSPDPTPTMTFTWTANLTVHENVPSRDVDFASDIVQNATTTGEALYTLQFNDSSAFRGGNLKLKATATVNGNPLTGETPAGLRIVGTNPQRTTFQGYIDQQNVAMGHGLSQADVQDVLKRIACQESGGQRQFTAAANGGIGPALISFDDGIGLFQITNSPCDPFAGCRNVMFNWQENADAGIRAFREKVGIAVGYPGRVRRNQQYQDFIENVINPQREAAGRRPIPGTPAPGWTTNGVIGSNPPNELLEDSVRGYNGFAGTNQFGLALHEFTPDTDFLLNATDQDLRGINNDARVWRRVPAADRPATGDPDYFNRVRMRTPQCGG
jgi:hypothetical protein